MTLDEARHCAARGAALLDRRRPGWANQIAEKLLDPDEPLASLDVLAELYGGDRGKGLTALGINAGSADEQAHGFPWLKLETYQEQDPEPEDEDEAEADDPAKVRWQRDCYRLHKAWCEQIAARRT